MSFFGNRFVKPAGKEVSFCAVISAQKFSISNAWGFHKSEWSLNVKGVVKVGILGVY